MIDIANFAQPLWPNGLAGWTSNSKVVGSNPIEGDRLVDKNYTVFQNTQEKILLYEYRDLFIDMDVGNNRSELAISNRHQER